LFLTKVVFYPRNEWTREKFKKKISKLNKRERRIICQMNQNFGNVNEQRSNEINQITTPLRARAS